MGTYIGKTKRTYHRRSYLCHKGEYIPLFLSIWKTKGMLKSCNNEVWQNLTQQFNKHEQMGFLWTIPRHQISCQSWLYSLYATKTVYPLPKIRFFLTAARGVFLFDFKYEWTSEMFLFSSLDGIEKPKHAVSSYLHNEEEFHFDQTMD